MGVWFRRTRPCFVGILYIFLCHTKSRAIEREAELPSRWKRAPIPTIENRRRHGCWTVAIFRRKLSNGIVPVVVSTSGNVNIWTCRCPLTVQMVFPHYPKTRVKSPKSFGVTSGIFMTIHMTTSVPIRPLPQPSLLQLLTEPHRPKSNGLRPVDPLSQVQISDSALQVRWPCLEVHRQAQNDVTMIVWIPSYFSWLLLTFVDFWDNCWNW